MSSDFDENKCRTKRTRYNDVRVQAYLIETEGALALGSNFVRFFNLKTRCKVCVRRTCAENIFSSLEKF